ncbi:MAG: o-succinylbenzoate synthase [Planctomycetes bacterium]|nr:o-succinylbenzoate synthase [Planctomycetota bacterium]
MYANLHNYRLELKQNFINSCGSIAQRTSIVLSLSDNTNTITGFGEACPMPQHGAEDIQQCQQALSKWVKKITKTSQFQHISEIHSLCNDLAETPCAQFCAESACIDFLARKKGLSFAQLLNPHAGSTSQVNALIGINNHTLQEITDCLQHGFLRIKLKYGKAHVAADITAAQELQKNYPPQNTFRFDANGAWSLDDALSFLQQVPHQIFDFIEDPCTDIDDLCTLAHQAPQKIALDLHPATSVNDLVSKSPVQIFIIKPMIFGSIIQLSELHKKIMSAGKRCVFSSFIEGNIGRSALAHICTALDPRAREHHGLDTAKLIDNENSSGNIHWGGNVIEIPQETLGCGVDKLI